jgi:hypothetical protein
MAKDPSLSNAAVLALLNQLDTQINGGTGAVVNVYASGCCAVPSVADAAATGTLLAQLAMCSTNAFGCAADQDPGGRITANCICSDCCANATGTADYYRILTQACGTSVWQGTVGTTSCFDLTLNTACITSGSTVSVTSLTIDLAET